MLVTASIVTYRNKKEVLDAAVNSFLNTDMDIRLYIVDNSPNDTIRTWYTDPRIIYIYNKKNIGFGAAHNIIMRDVSKLGKYHLVLNPDIRFKKETIEAIYQFMEKNPNIGNCMPRIIYPNGDLQYLCKLLPTPVDWIIRMFIPSKKLRAKIDYWFEMRFTGYDKIMDVPYLSGCFMFLRTEVIKEIGVFDEGIFMYGEDTDLNRRIFQKYRTVYFPERTIIHDFEKGSHKNLRLFWIHVKAAVYYLNKWGWFWDSERKRINRQIKEQYKS
ncbi:MULTISPECIES: glycosyltransferase family 2 protein [Butyricimonas]|uniref:glycosyltransferase family 2 protein n=1 Tax=Butyricimonas TaxID=574697 RepID=UPI0007FB2C5F|nr:MULTISPECIES: glycosyltransferase family 2 protein [Butyricimonas]